MIKKQLCVSFVLSLAVNLQCILLYNGGRQENDQLQTQAIPHFKDVDALINGFPEVYSKLKNNTFVKIPVDDVCPKNGTHLQHLLRIVCATAHGTNHFLQKSCLDCFSTVVELPTKNEELSSLRICASQYYSNTIYSHCTELLYTQTNYNMQTVSCYTGHCEFVRCLRRTNSLNLITQCTQEAKPVVNNTMGDDEDVRFFTDVTSCILSKSRCGSFNPISGLPQTPGVSKSGASLRNALHFSEEGDLRIVAFPLSMPMINSFCCKLDNITESTWRQNVC